MRRNDTTARKWNASKPSYDEDWSDEEHQYEYFPQPLLKQLHPHPQPQPPQFNPHDITKHITRPPWVPQSDADLKINAEPPSELHKEIVAIPHAPQNSETIATQSIQTRATYVLEDGPYEPYEEEEEEAATVDETSYHPERMLPVHDQTVSSTNSVYQLERAPQTQGQVESSILEHTDVLDSYHEPPTDETLERNSVEVPRHGEIPPIGIGNGEVRHVERTRRQSVSLSQSDRDFFKLDADEDLRLEALMFNPDDLPLHAYSDDEEEGEDEKEEEEKDTPRKVTADKAVDRQSTVQEGSPVVPSYPADFRDGLKSRALSDAILETMHSSSAEGAKAASMENLTSSTASPTAERTPSIMLAANTWAEKNRVLKEQLEKNKRAKAQAQTPGVPQVRASTYDVEYDYEPAIPSATPKATLPDVVGLDADADVAVGQATPVTNLNTLIEEDEEQEEAAGVKDVPTRAVGGPNASMRPQARNNVVPRVPLSLNRVAANQDDRPTSSTSRASTISPPLSSTSSSHGVRSYNTQKSLPPIRDTHNSLPQDAATEEELSDASGTEDGNEASDDTLTADQEFAMLQTLGPPRGDASGPDHKGQNLPPILQATEERKRKQLPSVVTVQQNAGSSPDDAYSPSLYSAMPGESHERPTASLEHTESGKVSPSIAKFREQSPRRSGDPSTNAWRPLNASGGVRIQSSQNEVSRFSTSTTQSADARDNDEYTFDMRDSFNPAVPRPVIHDSTTHEQEDPSLETTNVQTRVRNLSLDRGLSSSASMATIQAPLRHLRSIEEFHSNGETATATESERLADELLLQLSQTDLNSRSAEHLRRADEPDLRSETNNSQAEVFDHITQKTTSTPSLGPPIVLVTRDVRSEPAPVLSASSSADDQSEHSVPHADDPFSAGVRPANMRLRSSSTGSKFMELMSPMTSMDQQRVNPASSYQTLKAHSASLLRYKDIKDLPTAGERINEYTRRSFALQQSSSGLGEYLVEIQTHLQRQGREMPRPAPHVELKASRSIIPDKFAHSELSRTTARLGDRSKDAAKGLISKSTRGFKGLFHSNSRSVSGGSQKAKISSPLEVSGSNRTVSMIGGFGKKNKPGAGQRNSFLGPPEMSDPAHSHHNNQMATAPVQRLVSPMSQHSFQSSSSQGREFQTPLHSPMSSPSQPIVSTSPSHAPSSPSTTDLPPTPRANNAIVSRIQTYFPKVSVPDIERALATCEGDEQRAIGFLVVQGNR